MGKPDTIVLQQPIEISSDNNRKTKSKKPRQREGRACDKCITMHRGCNRGTPCDKCIRYGYECYYSMKRRKSKINTTTITPVEPTEQYACNIKYQKIQTVEANENPVIKEYYHGVLQTNNEQIYFNEHYHEHYHEKSQSEEVNIEIESLLKNIDYLIQPSLEYPVPEETEYCGDKSNSENNQSMVQPIERNIQQSEEQEILNAYKGYDLNILNNTDTLEQQKSSSGPSNVIQNNNIYVFGNSHNNNLILNLDLCPGLYPDIQDYSNMKLNSNQKSNDESVNYFYYF